MPYNEQRGYSLCREATKENKINAVGIVEYYRSAKQVCFALKLGGRRLMLVLQFNLGEGLALAENSK